MNDLNTISGAIFSDPYHHYRHALWRKWNSGKPYLLFVGLNPSTATEVTDDPTIRRVVRFARDNGYGGIYVGNLFSIVSSDPSVLIDRSKTAGLLYEPGDTVLIQIRDKCAATLVGWGTFGEKCGKRPADVLSLVGKPVYCLGKTKSGEPKHPLYLRADTPFIEYER
ncbi:MAG: DUF1643 domain-containing protein [Syntrophales bacterium]|nr:DUF1643 domain-containing protein [Syntrophales bacterium]